MTDNDIIKAFNEGIGLDDIKICIAPSFFGKDSEDKNEYITLATIRDVFNRQKAEIERLNSPYEMQVEASKKLENSIKVEAVKEFEERVIKKICEKVYAPTPVQSCIVEKCNQVIVETAKEMVGEQNAPCN